MLKQNISKYSQLAAEEELPHPEEACCIIWMHAEKAGAQLFYDCCLR
jgi:hypothetical protein